VSTPGQNRKLSREDCSLARELHLAYSKLVEDTKLILQISIDSLNLAIRRDDALDAFIDLGIAFESLFLHDSGGENIVRPLIDRTRVFFADSFGEGDVGKTVEKIYDLRSRAVHHGTLDGKRSKRKVYRDDEIRQLREAGQDLVSKAIQRVIEVGSLPQFRLEIVT
jgi:hypothetical protein